jgi:hypothetical protein
MAAPELFATIDRFEKDQHGNELAVLVFDDGQQLNIAVDRLPEGCREGTVVNLELNPEQGETERRRQRVKQVQSRLFGARASESTSDTREQE